MTIHHDITAIVVLHEEQALCLPAIASLLDLARTAQADGLTVETIMMLDAPDHKTRSLAMAHENEVARIVEVAYRDLGLTRNHAAAIASGSYLSFLDGDDLWGAEWLRLAFRAATQPKAPFNAIWHPQVLYLFDEADFGCTSFDRTPHTLTHSLHLISESSDAPGFDSDALALENTWGAVAFARREVYLRHPYRAIDRVAGFGIEDWSWNIETLSAGYMHKVVEGTVHLHRENKKGSLGILNLVQGLLPYRQKLHNESQDFEYSDSWLAGVAP